MPPYALMFCSLIASARTTVPPTLLRATYLMLPDVACEYGSLITERFTLSTIVYALEKSPKAIGLALPPISGISVANVYG